jgi:hypothetical protein
MPTALRAAAILILLVGAAHSYLGERYILMRLFRRTDLPRLFGSADFTVRTLRFAWHVTTLAWAGLAGVLLALAHPPADPRLIARIVGAAFLAQFLLALVGSRGRHLSWAAFLAIGVLAVWS